MVKWAKIPASVIGLVKSTNKSLLEILEINNQYLEFIQVGFLQMVREQREGGRRLEITCFFEELPLPIAGIIVSPRSPPLLRAIIPSASMPITETWSGLLLRK